MSSRRIAGHALVALALCAGAAMAQWVSVGPDGGLIQCLAVHPQDRQTVFAVANEATHSPRVYRSTDLGGTWQIAGLMCDSLVTSLAVSNDSHVFACGRDTFVHVSTDHGATWSSRRVGGNAAALAVDWLQSGYVYCAGYGRNGNVRPVVHVSTDYGESWTTYEIDTLTGNVTCCVVVPDSTRAVYAGGASGRLHRSTDQGQTWQLRNSGLRPNSTILSISATTSGVLLAGTTVGLYRSPDCGLSWELVADTLRQWQAEFSVDPDFPEMAYAMGYDFFARFFVSSDTGRTWQEAGAGVEVDRNGGVRAVPLEPGRVFLYGNAGVQVSTDRGQNWRPANSGLRFSGISAIGAAPWDQSKVFAAASGSTAFRSTDAGQSWSTCAALVACGNLAGFAFAPPPAERVYTLEGAG